MTEPTIRIHIDFPALDRFVTYLCDRDTSQRMFNEAAATIYTLADRLQATRVFLQIALENQ